MSTNSKIEWTDHTFNPWEGCQKVGPGCDNCYAEARNARFGGGLAINWGPGAPRRRTSPANWALPLRWNAQHDAFIALHGRRQRVFCASLADVFDNAVDPLWRADLFALIRQTPNLDWLLLTKRIGNVFGMLPLDFNGERYPNVWLGATIVNQAEADRDIPKLLAVNARVRFLSMEPLLGPVGLGLQCENWSDDIAMYPETGAYECCKACDYSGIGNAIDWVIVGGESGPGARPMHPDWARALRDQCQAAGVPFLFKQWGEWLPWTQFCDAQIDDPPEQTRFETREWEDGAWRDAGKPDYWATMDGDIDDEQCVGRVGKKAAGRLLDGRTWDEAPA